MLYKAVIALAMVLLPQTEAFTLSAPSGAVAACRAPAATIEMAHHVQKKATRAHNAYRPKKKRPSDIYRKPPSYPAMPDIPWMTKLSSGDAAAAPSQ